jgi:hypothetical protein
MNASRGWHSMIAVNTRIDSNSNLDSRLFVFGGCYLIQSLPSPLPPAQLHANYMHTAQPVTLTEFYTPKTNQWTIVKPMINLHKEASCSLSLIDSSLVYIYGGYNVRDKTSQKLISQYDCVKDAWSTVGQLTLGMTGVGACVLDLPNINHNESADNEDNQLNELNLFRNFSNSTSDNDSLSETKDDDDEWTTQNLSTSFPTPSDNDSEQFNNKSNLRLLMTRLKIRKLSTSTSSSNSFSSSSSSTMSHLAGLKQK